MGCCQCAVKEEYSVVFREETREDCGRNDDSFSDILIDSRHSFELDNNKDFQSTVTISEPVRFKSVSISRATNFEEAFLYKYPLFSQRRIYSKTILLTESAEKHCETLDTDRKDD